MRFSLLFLYWILLTTAQAQPVPKSESARYWVERGGQLMASGQFSKAYSAFQLARSLGAPGMVARMEDARRRNVNYILLQSLLTEARSLGVTDPAQGMRLLEHAHRHFPDSSRIMQELGTLANQPNLWPFSLKSAQLWPSPGLRYVVVAGSPARLYACRGDSLTSLYTFAAPVENAFFAPGDRLVWVATSAGTLLLDCQPTVVRVVSQFPDVMVQAVCSPDGRYMLAAFANDGVNRLYRVRKSQLEKTDVGANPIQSIFSPDGRFLCLLATEGLVTVRQLYRLTDDGPQLLHDLRAQKPLSDAAFSPDGRWLLMEGKTQTNVILAHLAADSVRMRRFDNCHADRLREAFSNDGRWLLLSFLGPDQDSLWSVQADSIRLRHVFQPQSGQQTWRVLSRFSPNGSWLLRSSPNGQGNAQCWSLRGQAPELHHQFTAKNLIQYDEFSLNGRYLLSRHLSTDSLWQCTDAGLVPVHGFQSPLRLTATPLPGSAVYPSFSPDDHLLVTYHSGATPDSLWQLDADHLTPLYGFRERLSAVFTLFSADTRWVLSGGNTLTDKALFRTSALWALQQPQLQAPLLEARFSEGGQYLLGRSVAIDSATVLYRVQSGRLTLRQKLTLPFWIDECRFLDRDRFLFTYHESKAAANTNSHANYLWRITNDGLTPLYRFRDPYVQLQTLLNRNRRLFIDRRLMVAPDGQHLFTHTGKNVADSLWKLTDSGPVPMRAVEPTATGLFSFQRGNDNIQIPGAGFIDTYFWQTRARDNRVTLQPIQPATQPVYLLPEGVDHLFGFSPRTGHVVLSLHSAEPVLYVYQGGQWRALRSFPGSKYDYQDGKKPGEPAPNLLSADGRLLFIRTADRFWVYRLNGPTVGLLYTQAGKFEQFAFASDGTNSSGVVFSNSKETFWLNLRAGGCRVIRLGEGTLHQPPTVRNGLLYVTRQLTDGQVAVDLLEQATGVRLAQTVVRQFLAMTVRPDGTAWLATRSGMVMLYTPTERLAWLRQSGLSTLSKELAGKYAFE